MYFKREILSTRIWYIRRKIGRLDLLYCIFTRTNISKLLLKNGYIQKEIFVVRQDTTKHEEHIRLQLVLLLAVLCRQYMPKSRIDKSYHAKICSIIRILSATVSCTNQKLGKQVIVFALYYALFLEHTNHLQQSSVNYPLPPLMQ